MKPICCLCNKSIGTSNMETFMTKYGFAKNINWNSVCAEKLSSYKFPNFMDQLVNGSIG